jgi:hypothetical protein
MNKQIQNGKGNRSAQNCSTKKFREGWDSINWHKNKEIEFNVNDLLDSLKSHADSLEKDS